MEHIVHGIRVDYSRDALFSESGLQRLTEGYLTEEDTSPQDRFAFIAKAFSSNQEHAERLYKYSSLFWLSNSTPILSYNNKPRSLPISCYGSRLGDSIREILDTSSETRMMAVAGGGVGLHVGLRSGDKKSSGIIPHLKTYDDDTHAYKQGSTRRGATAAYLDINHPEIIDFLNMRKASGGDPNRKCLNLHHGVNLTDDFMQRIEKLSLYKDDYTTEEREAIDKFPLIDPHSLEVVEYVSATELWEKFITLRMETGEPYGWFIDTVNRALPEYQRAAGLRNHGSNLCSEISLVTDSLRAFVCCISSVNLEYYFDWKDDPYFIGDIVEMLDNALTIFINKVTADPLLGDYLKRAVYAAQKERAIGVGALGWHALLQKRSVPFESAMAASLNKQIWKNIHAKGMAATKRLAEERGPCPDSADSDNPVRNSHVFAIAPNASSSIILNTSPSIEPYRANVYVEKGVSGTKIHKNRFLLNLLEEKGKDLPEVWESIIAEEGSVQKLRFLSDYEKDVFKTADEIDQMWVIQHAADRQPYVCQAQSLNIFMKPTENIGVVHLVHLMAWKMNLKSLYYLRTDSLRKADKVGQKVIRERIEDMAEKLKSDEPVCLACE